MTTFYFWWFNLNVKKYFPFDYINYVMCVITRIWDLEQKNEFKSCRKFFLHKEEIWNKVE